MQRIRQLILPSLTAVLLAAGCRGLPASGEKSARHDLAAVGGQLQTNLPVLATNATLHDSVLFAVRNHPQVIAAYADWAAAVRNITVARSRPDPKLTFQLYAADVVSSRSIFNLNPPRCKPPSPWKKVFIRCIFSMKKFA